MKPADLKFESAERKNLMATPKRPITGLYRQKQRLRSRKQVRDTSCPKCGWFFSLSFLARASVFSKAEKCMGGKQIVCPNCKELLWYTGNGEIQFIEVKLARVIPAPLKVNLLRWIRCFVCAL